MPVTNREHEILCRGELALEKMFSVFSAGGAHSKGRGVGAEVFDNALSILKTDGLGFDQEYIERLKIVAAQDWSDANKEKFIDAIGV